MYTVIQRINLVSRARLPIVGLTFKSGNGNGNGHGVPSGDPFDHESPVPEGDAVNRTPTVPIETPYAGFFEEKTELWLRAATLQGYLETPSDVRKDEAAFEAALRARLEKEILTSQGNVAYRAYLGYLEEDGNATDFLPPNLRPPKKN